MKLKNLLPDRLRIQEQNGWDWSSDEFQSTSTTTTSPNTTPAPSPDTKPAAKKDAGRIELTFQKISDNFIAIYEKIDQLYKDKTYWEPFKGNWYSNDDETTAVNIIFGEDTNEPGTWWFKNIQTIIDSIESEVKRIDAINIDNLSPENIGRLKTAKRNLETANSLYETLRETTRGGTADDEVSWIYYGGITDSDTNKPYKVDTDF